MAIRFSKLTRPAIRSLKLGASISEHGITFRRDANGDGVYSVNVMVDRRRIHRVIGRESEGVTRQQAEDYIAQVRTDARRQRLELPEGRKTPLSFEEAANRYVQRLRDSDGKNIDIKERQLRQHLAPFFATKPLSAIESFDVERYKKARRSAGAAKATVNRELATLSHLLNQAVEWKWIRSKSVKIARFKEDNQRIVYLTDDQCVSLLEAAASDHNENVHAFVMVGLHTGMRHAEILAIRREDVDVGKRVIWVPQAKAGAREQPITRELAEYLERRTRTGSEVPTAAMSALPTSGEQKCCTTCRTAASGKLQRSALTYGHRLVWAVRVDRPQGSGSGHSPQLRELRVREEQAAIQALVD